MQKIWPSLTGIIVIAVAFSFWALGRNDIITDESSYATRAIGLVDFDFGIEQPTPWQWVDEIPWWMHLSFHDHPPLVFLVQHFSMQLFGETPFAVRLPSALAGVTSVLLLYFIGKRLYSAPVGLASSALFAVTANHVWISRIGLQESILIVLMLAATSVFLQWLNREYPSLSDRTNVGIPGWLYAALTGLLLGFAFLVKYLALILIPIFLTIFWLQRKRSAPITPFYFLLSIFCFLVIASPVIIYNIELFRNFGHFDFQFSLLFGQDVQAWQSRPGQESLGSLGNRIAHFIPWLIGANSPYFLLAAAAGLILAAWETLHRRTALYTPLSAIILWLVPFLVFVGPAYRFLTILTPWLAIAAGYGAVQVYQRLLPNRRTAWLALAAFAAFAAFEGFYSYSSVIAISPIGKSPWAHSRLRGENSTWGFNQLEEYVARELDGKMPEVAITFQYQFAREILGRAVAANRAKGLEAVPIGIVYNGNMNTSAELWTFLRRITYQGWPIMSAEIFRNDNGRAFLQQSGVKKIYFFNSTAAVLHDRFRVPTPDGDIMEEELRRAGVAPTEIRNLRGELAFRVYQFEL